MVLSKIKKAAGKLEKRPAEAPKTSMDMVFTLAEAIRFGYGETLGKWNLLDMPRAILYSIMEKVHPFPTFPSFKVSSSVNVLTGFL